MALLKILVTASPPQRKAILCAASDDLVGAISEIALNTLKGNIPISASQHRVLKKKRQLIKKLSNKRASLTSKKKLVKQSGGLYRFTVRYSYTSIYKPPVEELMDYAQKMYLVPQQQLEQLTPTTGDAWDIRRMEMLHLDAEIKAILTRTDLKPEAKVGLYFCALQNFLQYYKRMQAEKKHTDFIYCL